MKKRVFQQPVTKQLRACKKLLKEYENDPRPELLHRFRIGIKKINAACQFAEALAGKAQKPAALRPAFRAAGRIRNLHVYRNLLNSLPPRPLHLIRKLELEEMELSRRFRRRIPVHLRALSESGGHVEIHLPDHPKRLGKYFSKKFKKITSLLESADRKKLHPCRKEMKRLMAVLEWLPHRWKKELPVNLILLDRLQELTGKWHDTNSFLQFSSRRQFTENQFPRQRLQALEHRQFQSVVAAYRKQVRIHAWPNKGAGKKSSVA